MSRGDVEFGGVSGVVWFLRLVGAGVLGGVAFLVSSWLSNAFSWAGVGVWRVSWFVVTVCGLVACLWPLTAYLDILVVGMVNWSASIGVALLFVKKAARPLPALLEGSIVSLVWMWFPVLVGLVVLVWLRRRWWPVYGEGLCQRCGYELRGLVEPRCPECGTGFVIGDLVEGEGGDPGVG